MFETVQHLGDYAEVLSGGQPIDDDLPLTLADLEGIGTPDLTSIVESLKRDTMDPVERSLVDIVDDDAVGRLDYVSLDVDDPNVVDDYEIDPPVSQTGFSTDDADYLGDGPYKGYLLSEADHLSQGSPRLRRLPPSPTAEQPGDVSEAHLGMIADLRKGQEVGPHSDRPQAKY